MTLAKLYQILKQTGYPVSYSHFNKPPTPPYICYLELDTDNFHADNKTFHNIKDVAIELYTEKKDLIAESTIESVLDANEIPYDSSETYIESEKLFQKNYEVRMI